MRYRLRTLLILVALGPVAIWTCWANWPPRQPNILPPPLTPNDDIQHIPQPDWSLPTHAAKPPATQKTSQLP
jgi:hypothetical protein